MVARVAVADATIAPDELQRRVCVSTLLEVHLPRVIAERAETVPRVAIAHREPLQIFPERLAFFLPEVGDVEFRAATSAGWNVVVNAVVHRHGLVALTLKEAAADRPADFCASVGQRIEDRLADLEALVLRLEALHLRPVAGDRAGRGTRAPEEDEVRLERIGNLKCRRAAPVLRHAVLDARARVRGE